MSSTAVIDCQPPPHPPPPTRQRADEDKKGARAAATAEVITAWLPLLDSFEAATAAQAAAEVRSGPPPPGEAQVHAAYRALQIQLLEILK
jgi:molecular chaperone GrpE (heat shock protein)